MPEARGSTLACVDLAGGPPPPDTRNERGHGATAPRPPPPNTRNEDAAPPTCVNTRRAALCEDDAITDISSAKKVLPPGNILRGVDVPAHVGVHAHSLDLEGAQHPAHPHSAERSERGISLVEDAAQRARAIDTHEVLIERLRNATAHDASLRPLTQRGFEEGGQKGTNPGSVDGNDDDEDIVADAQRAQTGINTSKGTAVRRVLEGAPDTVRDAYSGRHDGHAARAARLQKRSTHTINEAHATQRQIRLRDATQALSPTAADDDRSDVSARGGDGTQSHGAKVSTSARCVAASIIRTRPISGSPKPTSTLIASVAIAVPA